MKKLFFLLTVLFSSVYSATAQETSVKTPRIYLTGVSLLNSSSLRYGSLYEVKDSSIVVSDLWKKPGFPNGRFTLSEYNYNEVRYLWVRNRNSFKTGVIIGGIVGLVSAMAISYDFAGGTLSESWGLRTFVTGMYTLPVCTGIGALTGLIHVKFPIDGRYDYYTWYRNKMQKYSFLREPYSPVDIPRPVFYHRFYIGLTLGPSFPVGSFASKSVTDEKAGKAKVGGTGTFTAGCNFSPNFAVSFTSLTGSYTVEGNDPETWWSIDGYMLTPSFTIPVGRKLLAGVKPGIGYTTSSLVVDGTPGNSGNAFAACLYASSQYNLSERWCVISEAGYFFSNQKYTDNTSMSFQTLNINLGVAFRFL